MKRYRFHAFSHVHAIDQEGSDHRDLAGVRAYAVACARDMMREDLRLGVLDLGHRIEAQDQHGAVVYVLYYRDAITIMNG
jgi:hypothetical protein